MSTGAIEEIIRSRCEDGKLFPIDPSVSSDPCVRGLYVSAEIHRFLDGPGADQISWSKARSIMDSFVSGKIISVSRGKKYRKDTFMGHLDPQTDGVWTMKPSDPPPGIRIFGQFAKKDLFVAVDWRERMALEDYNSIAWRGAIRTCKQKWSGIFDPYRAINEDDSHAYISNIILI